LVRRYDDLKVTGWIADVRHPYVGADDAETAARRTTSPIDSTALRMPFQFKGEIAETFSDPPD
jgi:hypothetical protein